ncbi:MAG: hypothetical protein IID46_05030 [Planctomycetes bacterium]|nr:hypothetical protein [Planctomycetota bacterium]
MNDPHWKPDHNRPQHARDAYSAVVMLCDELGFDLEEKGYALYLIVRMIQEGGGTLSNRGFFIEAFPMFGFAPNVFRCSDHPLCELFQSASTLHDAPKKVFTV